ncbi:MAG: hypothetical protein C0478_07265 [Planctomyces sp.]|nr:hypothetical protein [Planctomyces sp.]
MEIRDPRQVTNSPLPGSLEPAATGSGTDSSGTNSATNFTVDFLRQILLNGPQIAANSSAGFTAGNALERGSRSETARSRRDLLGDRATTVAASIRERRSGNDPRLARDTDDSTPVRTSATEDDRRSRRESGRSSPFGSPLGNHLSGSALRRDAGDTSRDSKLPALRHDRTAEGEDSAHAAEDAELLESDPSGSIESSGEVVAGPVQDAVLGEVDPTGIEGARTEPALGALEEDALEISHEVETAQSTSGDPLSVGTPQSSHSSNSGSGTNAYKAGSSGRNTPAEATGQDASNVLPGNGIQVPSEGSVPVDDDGNVVPQEASPVSSVSQATAYPTGNAILLESRAEAVRAMRGDSTSSLSSFRRLLAEGTGAQNAKVHGAESESFTKSAASESQIVALDAGDLEASDDSAALPQVAGADGVPTLAAVPGSPPEVAPAVSSSLDGVRDLLLESAAQIPALGTGSLQTRTEAQNNRQFGRQSGGGYSSGRSNSAAPASGPQAGGLPSGWQPAGWNPVAGSAPWMSAGSHPSSAATSAVIAAAARTGGAPIAPLSFAAALASAASTGSVSLVDAKGQAASDSLVGGSPTADGELPVATPVTTAATNGVGRVASAAPTTSSEIAISQVAQRILDSTANGILTAARSEQNFSIVLSPENYGELTIDVRQNDEGVSVRLEATTGAGHELLSGHLAELHELLEQRGLAVDQITVDRIEAPRDVAAPSQPEGDQNADDRSREQQARHDRAETGTNGSGGGGAGNSRSGDPSTRERRIDGQRDSVVEATGRESRESVPAKPIAANAVSSANPLRWERVDIQI